jgi:DNA polymerase-4
MERQIVCFGIPRLAVALARLDDPTLRTRPVAVAFTHTSRAMIHEVSSEAEEAGVVPSLQADQARRRCPSLRLVPPNPTRVAQAHHALMPFMTPIAPIWESYRPGHFYLDLTGTTRLFGATCDTTMRLERDVSAWLGLQAVAGIGTNKLVAHMASSLLTPPQLCDVRAGSEQDFLSPLPVSTLPGLQGPGGTALQTRLADLNLQTIGDVSDVSVEALEAVCGRWGHQLYQWARGIDCLPVIAPEASLSLTHSYLFEPDTIDYDRLIGGLSCLLDSLCHDLRRQHRLCHRLMLTLLYSDQLTVQRSSVLSTPTHWEVDMFPSAQTLFRRCFQRRVRIRSLIIRSNSFCPPPEQLSLFPPHASEEPQAQPRPHRLALALDRLHTRFGMKIIQWGRSRMATHSDSIDND